MKAIFASGITAILLGALSAACSETATGNVRVFTTEPACFEFLFTGVSDSADGKPVLSFNHRNDRTYFVRPGEQLGPYRITAFEAKTNSVFYPSLNASLDKPSGRVILSGPGNTTLILEQNQPLPWSSRTAWLVQLDNGAWWNINEEDVFVIDKKLVFVEEIDEDGVVVTAGRDLEFIQRIADEEKSNLKKLWAERKREEELKEEIAFLRQDDEARTKAKEKESAGDTSYMVYNKPGMQVEVRGPPRFFYGTEYRFPTAYKAGATAISRDGRLIGAPIVIPSSFETRYSGISITGQ